MSRTIEIKQSRSRTQHLKVTLGAAALGIAAAGVGFAAERAGHHDESEVQYGYYMVQPGENATDIGRELGDGNDHIVGLRDEIQAQADENGNLQPGQIVQVNEAYVDHQDALEVPQPGSAETK